MENQPLWCCFEGFVLRLHLLVTSVPGSPAGGRDGAWLPLDHVVRCSSAIGAVVRVLMPWGPLLVPGLFDSPATEILSFFLDSFEVVVEWFSSSHCWSLLHWRHLSVFRPAFAGDRYLSGFRAGDCGLLLRRQVHVLVLMVACLPLLRVWLTAPSHIPLMLCASAGIYFRSILASSRLSFVWVFGGLVQVFSCLALSVPVGVRSGFAPADFSSLWFCLVEESSVAIFLEVVTRLGFLSVPCHRHCQPCRASPFLGHSPFRRWWRPSLFGKHRIEKRSVFLFSAPQVSVWGPCFRSVGLFSSWLEWWLPLVEVFGVVSWSPSSAGGFSPIRVPWVPVYLVSLALALSSCCLRHVQVACSFRCRSCSSQPSPDWFSSKT